MDCGKILTLDPKTQTLSMVHQSDPDHSSTPSILLERPGSGAIIDSQGYSKTAHADSGEESPLSPPMAWSREGTSEELSKYQEFQMRQNDGHHRSSQAQQSLSGAAVPSTPPTVTNPGTALDRRAYLVANLQSSGGPGSFSEAVRGSHGDQTLPSARLRTDYNSSSSNSSSRRSDRLEPTTSESSSTTSPRRDSSSERVSDSTPSTARQRHSPSSSPSTRQPKSSRSKTKSKGHNDGSHYGLELSTSPATVTRSERIGSTPLSPHCQRHRLSGSGTNKKAFCPCTSCQQEGSILTPSQRPYRYGQYLGSEPIPIYAGPLGLGDDIPSPTPSPPTSGRMSIHMAMSGHSPIGSPVHSPTVSIAHSPIGKSSPSLHRSPSSKSRSGRHPVTEGFAGSGELSFQNEQHGIISDTIPSPPTSHHPVITGFQTRDPKAKNSKKSPSQTTTHSVLDPNPLSSSSSPAFPSSYSNFNSHSDKDKDTSPSLSPFFSTKRSFSPPRHTTTHSTGASRLQQAMATDTLQAHNILRQNASVSHHGEHSAPTISHADFPRLAPPVVLVQSPTTDSLASLVEKVSNSSFPTYKQQQQPIDKSPLLYSSVLASSTTSLSTTSSSSPSTVISPNFSHVPRSPSQQPLSPRGKQSAAAATPPLSPSGKKEGHHYSVLSTMENKEFEAWSLSEQIQDRIVRASPYKSAVLSPTSSNHNKKPTASSQQPSQPQPQPLLSQPQQLLQEQPQPEPQPQVQVQQQHSPVSKLVQKPLSTPLVESISNKRQWQWQWRGQSSAKEIAGDKTPRKTAANTITSKMSIGGPGLGSPVVGTFGDSCTGQTLGNQGAVKSGNEDGSSHPTLRRTRSAPILASGQLSYADILKASIKASSDPNLSSSSSSSSSGYVSLLSPESNASHLHLSGSSSPLVTTNTTSVSGTFSSFNNSPDSTSFRSRLIVPLTPTRTMKPLRRRSLSNIKSEMTASSAPLKPLTPLATPLKAVESPSPGASTSTMDVDETPLSKVGGIGTGSVHKEVVIMDHSAKDSEDVEMSTIEETVEERGMEDVTSDLIAASAEEKESLMVQEKAEAMTGLSFFAPPEELDAEESSPDAIHHAQSIVAGSMMEFEPTVDVVKETLPDSETTLGTGATSNLIRTVSAPAMVSPLSVSLATKVSLKGDGDLEKDSYESITLESPDSANIGVTTSVQEEMKEEQGISVEHSSVVVMDEPETEHEAEPTESTASVAVAAVAAELECPFQKQLALQEQEETEIQQSKIAAEFKPRRKRNNSSGGKKLLLKKKTSLPNLRNSFQQQQQQQSQQQQQATSQSESDGSNLDSPISASGRVASIDYVIPPFYFPKGKPVAASKRRQRVHSAVTKAKEIFVVAENGVLSEAGLVAVTVHCCELPRYMNRALFRKIDASGSNEVRFQEFERVWESLVETCPDEISMIFSILKQPTANVLTPTDFEAVLQDLVLFHPGLEFLSGNAVFQERYLETVITRIFYEANRRYGTMKQSDLRRSNFDKTLRKLENSDLNQTEDCFSYKHFYVIYCKFWELDQDHDLILDEQDLAGYSGGAISTRIIRRVMQGYGNETGMFMVPDQGLVLQQQQQQLLLMQQQQLLQQHQQQLLLQQQQLLLRQQQQHQKQQHQQQEQLQAGNTDMDLDTAVLAHRPESADNSGDDEEVDEGMTEMTTPPGDGSPVPETKTLRRSKTMTLSGVNISSEFLTEGIMSPEEDAPTSSSPITATTTASPPAPVMISPTTPAATVTVQRTIPPGPGTQCRPHNYRMTYKGFIWFLLAETDKQTATSIEYWFRCMDLDGDGMLTVFELEQLFQEQAARMTILGMESFGFRDAICQMQDLVGPKETGLVRLSDLKQCGQAGPFIDLFCNVIRWRNFEAHQHQIRMRQQQIAMQRATEAAWEEVAVGEDLFDDEDEDEDEEGEGDDGEGCEDGDEDDEDEEEQDLEDEDEGEISDDYADGTERPTSPLSDAYSKPNAPNPTLFSPDIEMAEGRALSSSTSASLSSAAAESSCVGLGLAVEMDSHHDTNSKDLTKSPYQSLGRRGDHIKTVVPGEQNDELEDDDVVQDGSSSSGNAIIIGGSVELSPAATKALTRRNKEKRLKRRQSMARLALLEEQRKEKALLATIRESPWIVYVESEYEKLVTIERPQSRTGWEQEDEEEEEEEEEEEDDIDEGEDEVGEEEEVMDEDAHHHHQHQHQHQHHQHHHHLNIVEGGVDPIQLQLQQRQQQQRQQNQRELQQQQQELHIQQQRLQLQQQHQQHHQQQFGQISIDP